jgi:hypothetical protein
MWHKERTKRKRYGGGKELVGKAQEQEKEERRPERSSESSMNRWIYASHPTCESPA